MNRDDILPGRTERERAAAYVRRPRRARPKSPPQAEVLFDEPACQERRLVPVCGWPDYAAEALASEDEDETPTPPGAA